MDDEDVLDLLEEGQNDQIFPQSASIAAADMDMQSLDMLMKSSFGYLQTENKETSQFDKLFDQNEIIKENERKRLVSDDIFKEIDDQMFAERPKEVK